MQLQITRNDVDNRLHDAIDLLFTKTFFAQMNWSGISKTCNVTKTGLRNYKNILQLFVEIGSTNSLTPAINYVALYLQKKLRHAAERIHIDNTKRTSSRTAKRNSNNHG